MRQNPTRTNEALSTYPSPLLLACLQQITREELYEDLFCAQASVRRHGLTGPSWGSGGTVRVVPSLGLLASAVDYRGGWYAQQPLGSMAAFWSPASEKLQNHGNCANSSASSSPIIPCASVLDLR
jgi:hypothetical protein